MSTITVYASIGNSDDRLTQARWANYLAAFRELLGSWSVRTHGVWASEPSSHWQNACVCFEIPPGAADGLKSRLADLAEAFGQDSIAWAVAHTEFLGAATSDMAPGPGPDGSGCDAVAQERISSGRSTLNMDRARATGGPVNNPGLYHVGDGGCEILYPAPGTQAQNISTTIHVHGRMLSAQELAEHVQRMISGGGRGYTPTYPAFPAGGVPHAAHA